MPGRHEADSPAGVEAPGISDPESVARSILLQRLNRSPATRSQLSDLLARRGVPGDAADRVLDRFCEVGLIDDARYAVEWVESRRSTRGLAGRALAHELRSKGVEPEVIESALAGIEPGQEHQTALALAQQRVRSLTGHPLEVQRRRLAGFLARKGYPPGLVYEVVTVVTSHDASDSGD